MSQEEAKIAQQPAPVQMIDGVAQSFKMMDPTQLKTLLTRGLGPKVNSVM